MNRNFKKRLRDPDLEGVTFLERVRIVRARIARERSERFWLLLTGLVCTFPLTAVFLSFGALCAPAAREWQRQRESDRNWVIHDARLVVTQVEDRVWRDAYARARLRDRIREYQGRPTQHVRENRRSRPFAGGMAFFEAFPASGRGTFGPCSTTPPTGARGENLTFARASSGTCTKTATGGFATTGIADGDLVLLSSDQPRVEYDSNGVLGLLVETGRTNSLLRSQELDNAGIWIGVATAGAATVTANFATAPDGTLTADRLQTTACAGAGTTSGRTQGAAVVAPLTASVFVKGNGTSGSIGIAAGAAATYSGATCTYNATTWTRCLLPGAFNMGDFVIGCINNSIVAPNPGNTGAADVLVWGAQVEAGSYVTSYIPTTTVSVTRAGEWGYFDLGASSGVRGNVSAAVSVNSPSSDQVVSAAVFAINASSAADTSGTNSFWAYNASVSGQAKCYYGGVSTGVVATPAGSNRVWCAGVSGSSLNGAYGPNGMTAAGAPTAGADLRYVSIGGLTTAYAWDAINTRFCLDPNPARCR